ncbi:hypothetical protein FHY35_004046 [Xanthomonas arboricola]|uniref:hypothetical protein n=1 Tax=Xanthomonas arboricola TaxID=56448 RepID=UPI00141A6CFE|nr:hypothetical protein [Xanthomonas arboricola]NIJ86996.1 hypothetical protein [Xanthomonas arboricola]
MGVVTGAAVIGAAATVYSANQAKKGAKGAANATAAAQGEARYANQQNMQPYLNTGTNALNQLAQLNSGNYSSFQEAPDYQFTLQQGVQSGDRSAAARGSLYSGGHQADLMQYGQGLASQQYNNYYNKLAGLAGMGQSAAGALAGVNTGYANAVGGANAQAASSSANANAEMITGLAGLGNNALQNYAAGGRTSSYGTQPATSAWNGQMTTGQGSAYNFGNNLTNFMGRV